MKRLIAFVALALSTVLSASELAVRESPQAYPHTCAADGAKLGVDYLRRSLPTPRGMQHIPGVLIVELGVFPKPGRTVTLPSANFELDSKRWDHPLTPAVPELVVAQLLHGEWARGSNYPHAEASAGTVDEYGRNRGVIFGRPRREPRFPGDPNPDSDPERRPETPSVANIPSEQPHPDELPERILTLHALTADELDQPAGGYVYFLYQGKLTKLRELTLSVQVGDSACRLRIRD
ncbi:MAG: hypothetical protein O2968_17105 [Acidobacteria bacterium]|nr:hypothetical protein [Acidobacteriota bacterium]